MIIEKSRMIKSALFLIILLSLISIVYAPLPFTSDDDNDGIINIEDDCDNTLAGATVDPWGCSCEQKTCEWEENNSCRIECGGPKATCNIPKPDNTDCGDYVTCQADICKENMLYDYPPSSKGQCIDGVCIENKCEPEIIPAKECLRELEERKRNISCSGLTKRQCEKAENCKPEYKRSWIFRKYIDCVPITPEPVENRSPVILPIGNKLVRESELLTFEVVAIDPDGDKVKLIVENMPQNATLRIKPFSTSDKMTRIFKWTPSSGQIGRHKVTFTATDGKLNDSETVTIVIIRFSCFDLTKSECEEEERCVPRYRRSWVFRRYVGCVPRTPLPPTIGDNLCSDAGELDILGYNNVQDGQPCYYDGCNGNINCCTKQGTGPRRFNGSDDELDFYFERGTGNCCGDDSFEFYIVGQDETDACCDNPNDIVSNGDCITRPNIKPVAVISSPQNYQNFTVNETILFDGRESFDPDGTIAIYDWLFGNGPSSMTQTRLTLWLDKDGEKGHTVIQYFDTATGGHSFDSELLEFSTLNPGMYGVPESEYMTNGVRDYHYLFAEDYDFHYEVNPQHTYTDAETYTITLTVSDGFLEDTANVTINIIEEQLAQAELTISTLKDEYEIGEQINLTDPPAEANNDTLNPSEDNTTMEELIHPFKFYIDQSLIPDEEAMQFAINTLPKYVDDMNYILQKNTNRRLVFNPETDIIITTNFPDVIFGNEPYPCRDFEIRAYVKKTDLDYLPSHGGFSGFGSLNGVGEQAGIIGHLHWLQIWNPDDLAEGSDELKDYWIQIDHMLHELAHVFEAGVSEYYNLAIVDDNTGIEPIVDINLNNNPFGPYWGEHTEYFTDPLFRNVWNNPLVGSPTSMSNLLDTAQYSSLTSGIMDGCHVGDVSSTISNLSNVKLELTDESGSPLENIEVKIWKVSSVDYNYELIVNDVVNNTGTLFFNSGLWFGSNSNLILIKLYKNNSNLTGKYVSVFDAQESKVLHNESQFTIKIYMERDAPKSQILNTGNTSIIGYLFMEVQKLVNGSWQSYQIVVDETTSRTIPAKGYLGLDTIWNAQNIIINEAGTYKVNAEFRESYNGEPIQTTTGFLKNNWEFNVTTISEAELTVATLKNKYKIGEHIKLTDPPADNNLITGNVVNHEIKTPDIERIITEEELLSDYPEEIQQPEFNGYIVQLKEDPLVVEEKKLKSKAVKNDKKFFSRFSAFFIPKRFEPTLSSNVKTKLERKKINLQEKQDNFKQKALQALGKRQIGNLITGNIVSELNPDELVVLGEYKNVFNGIALDITTEEAEIIRELDEVEGVYPNYIVNITLMDSVPLINADDVWQIQDDLGRNITGQNVTIAIIDTGIDYTHPDLGGCLGIDCKVIGGYDIVNNDNDPMDDQGHGTHVAATAAGNGVLKGVAPDAKIYAYKVLDEGGYGSSDGIIEAIERAIDPNQDGDFSDHVDIISMSLGHEEGYADTDPSAIAVNNVVEAGVVAIISAGNTGPYPETIGCPGCAKKAITVGASDKSDEIADFSSRGPEILSSGNPIIKPDITAPGVSICAAQWNEWLDDRRCLDEDHIAISGTSMATPHVAGTVALIKQDHPEWSPLQIKYALKNTAIDIGEDVMTQGMGRIDVLQAIQFDAFPEFRDLVIYKEFNTIIKVNKLTQLNVVIRNDGEVEESDVNIDFYINGELIENRIIDSIEPGVSVNVIFEWEPQLLGYNNLSFNITNELPDLFPEDNYRNVKAWVYNRDNGRIVTGWNSVLDCEAEGLNPMVGPRSGSGIYMAYAHESVVKNCVLIGWKDGIRIEHSSGNRIENNLVQSNVRWGAILDYGSHKNNLTQNLFENNKNDGIRIRYSDNNSLFNNTVRFSKGYSSGIYLYHSVNTKVKNNLLTNNGYGVFLEYGVNNTLVENNVANNNKYNGIHLVFASDNIITNNIVKNNNLFGIIVSQTGDNTIEDNIVKDSELVGVYVKHCKVGSEISVSDNLVSGGKSGRDFSMLLFDCHSDVSFINNSIDGENLNNYGIYLENVENAMIMGNIINQNLFGILLENVSNLEVSNNKIYNSGLTGIYISYSNNTELDNNIILENELRGVSISNSEGTIVNDNKICGNDIDLKCSNSQGSTGTGNQFDSTEGFNGYSCSYDWPIYNEDYLHCDEETSLYLSLEEGWNWISINVLKDNMSLESVFEDFEFSEGDFIKSQSTFSTYYEDFGWYPDMVIEPEKLYKIRLSSPLSGVITGEAVNVQNTTINIVSGWNWIGYIPQQSLDINVALANWNATQGDTIKSDTQYATYVDGVGWVGSLQTLYPKTGYEVNSSAAASFVYNENQDSGAVLYGITDPPADINLINENVVTDKSLLDTAEDLINYEINEDGLIIPSDNESFEEFVPKEIIIKFKRESGVNSEGSAITSLKNLKRKDISLTGAAIVDTTSLSNVIDIKKIVKVEPDVKNYNQKKERGFDRLFTIKIDSDDVLAEVEKLNKLEEIEFAEPNYIAYTQLGPNDYYFKYSASRRWHLHNTAGFSGYPDPVADVDIDAPGAWDIEIGSEDIVIAVIDSGVDYDHEDLNESIWVNSGEDLNGNERFDNWSSSTEIDGIYGDLNGIDDDGNDYIDDVIGWDFVDISSSGCHSNEDCTDRDNDPNDIHSHGTHVAGIVTANTNNSIGIAGICWNCKVMAVRAAWKTTRGGGSLEYDDIIAGINYAVDNGARVISMSFGSSHISSALKEALNYAFDNGVVLIAGAGNNNKKQKFYPAAFDNVIGVSAIDWSNDKAHFSNYGSYIDVAAPGYFVFSTIPHQEVSENIQGYVRKSGTSMATPIVAGVAGLILSKNPDFSNEDVRQILRSSTEPVDSNKYIGLGTVNAYNALQFDSVPVANIDLDNTLGDSNVEGIIDIRGSAAGDGFSDYSIYIGSGVYPNNWTLFYLSNSEVVNDTLITMDTSLYQEGLTTVKLIVSDNNGVKVEDRVLFTIDNIRIDFRNNREKILISRNENITIPGTAQGTGFISYSLSYKEHENDNWILLHTSNLEVINGTLFLWNPDFPDCFNNFFDLKLEVISSGGIVREETTNKVYIDNCMLEGYPASITPNTRIIAPSVGVGDLDNDGNLEIVTTEGKIGLHNIYRKVYIFDYNGNVLSGWPKQFSSNLFSTPTLGDLDNDGDLEIIVGIGSSYLYAWHHDGTDVSGWPVSKAASFVTPTLADIDNDGFLEIITGRDKKINVFNHDGTMLDKWPAIIKADPRGSAVVGDLDGDGDLEFVIGGLNSNKIYAFHHDGSIVDGWPKSMSLWVWSSAALADIDSDGDLEIFIGADKHLRGYHHDGTAIDGWPNNVNNNCGGDCLVDNSPAIGDIDNDGTLEIVISYKKKVYAFNANGTNVTGWPVNLEASDAGGLVLGDIDGDYQQEILVVDKETNGMLYAFNSDGTAVPGWPKRFPKHAGSGMHYISWRTPVITDIDSDGDVDVVLGAEDKVYVWDLPSDYNPTINEWPMFQNDNRYSGLYTPKLPKSQILNTGNTSIIGYLFMEVQKLVNDEWQSYQIVVDEATSRTIPARNHLGLDTIWNEQNVTINEEGTYKVNAEFRESYNGEPIQTTTGFLNNNWEFNIKENMVPVAVISSPLDNQNYTVNKAIYFDGSQSFDPDDGELSYIWDLGDFSFRFDPAFYYSYSETGTYTVTLIVSDGQLNDSKSIIINIIEKVRVKDQWVPEWCYGGETEEEEERVNTSTGNNSLGSLSVSKLELLKHLGVDAMQVGSLDVSGLNLRVEDNEFIVTSEYSEQHIQRTGGETNKVNIFDEKGNSVELDISSVSESHDKNAKGYIVEFEEKPVLGYKKELRKEIEEEKEEINKLKKEIKDAKGILNFPKRFIKSIRVKNIESDVEDLEREIPSKLNEQEIKVTKQHKKLEKKIKKEVDKLEKKKINEYKKVLNAVALDISEKEAEKIKKIRGVKGVSPNKEVKIALHESIKIINADDVWNLTDFYGNNITGEGITIAILDTGVDYTHFDLGSCTNASFLAGDCNKVVGGYDVINEDNNPMDDHGHGTHVAATAAGNGVLKGVAPDAKIYAYKVLDEGGYGSSDGIIEAIERAVDPNQDGNFEDHLDIISMSFGRYGGTPDDPDAKAVDNAVEAGVIAVVAAGNSGPYLRTVGCPGCARKAITVAASGKCNDIAEFSSRGPVEWANGSILKPDITAPGVRICAAQWDNYHDDRWCLDDEHIAISGTSMATPHVAGAAALVLQANPYLTPEEVKSVLMSTSYDIGYDILEQGAGRVDVKKALDAEISIMPTTFSIDTIRETHFEKNITIKNLKDSDLALNLESDRLRDVYGNLYNFPFLNTSSILLPANSSVDIKLTIDLPQNMEGYFFGNVIVNTEQNEYTVRYQVSKLSTLTVTVKASNREIEPSVYIHDQHEISGQKPIRRGEQNPVTFRVLSGNYTVYATGDTLNWSFEYLIMENVNVPLESKVEKHLNIFDARPFTIVAKSLDGRDLKLYEWEKKFVTYNNETSFSVSYGDPTYGDRTVYISNKPDNDFDTDIILKYYGVPVNENR